MRNIKEFLDLYEQGIYTFGEVITVFVDEAALRPPKDLARELPERFIKGVAESVYSVPLTATADDVVVFKSSRAHAEAWFNGGRNWRNYFDEQPASCQ